MLLILDVISSISEFTVIDDNKVVFSKKIYSSKSNKLSENLFPIFNNINNKLNLLEKINKIVITNGPGSYTNLRIGSAFISGLQLSNKIKISDFSCFDMYKILSKKSKNINPGIFIQSASNQEFFCYYEKEKNFIYKKIDLNFKIPQFIDCIFYNENKINNNDIKLKQYKFSIQELILKNYNNLNFDDKKIIEPIYVSNNKILN
tara:strand:- start:552 stop:1163 length:612 start_codon:yes stop_codon:yes gene_type:complete